MDKRAQSSGQRAQGKTISTLQPLQPFQLLSFYFCLLSFLPCVEHRLSIAITPLRLLQPLHIRNQLFTSMINRSTHLLNFMYPDSSCCRDKVSRAAGRRAVGSVFCSPYIKCTVTSKWRFHYRDSYVIGFYCDQTTFVHLPGLAKKAAPRHGRQLIKQPGC